MAEKDPRFASISSDPRFKLIPKKERKVKIDRRFEAMFKDKKFKLKYSIDKRGRPLQQTTDESLRKFYDISDSSDSSDDEDEGQNDKGRMRNNVDDDRAEIDGRDLSAVKRKSGRSKGSREDRDSCSDHKVGRERRRRSGREELRLLVQARRERLRGGKDRSRNNERLPPTRAKLAEFSLRNRSKVNNNRVHDKMLGDREDTNDVIPTTTDGKMTGDRSEDTVTSSDEASSDDSSNEGDGQDRLRVDYSRGGAFMESSSSSEESDSDHAEDLEQIDIEHGWGELDRDARRGEDTSSRLALCNMDWDRISARDILAILSSFKPSGGVIKSVKVYISDLGLERMKSEDIHGPKELVEKDDKFEKLDNFTEKKYFREKLRKYQFQRLKYYYAIAECDSVGTASHIYDQCDNYEFESSAVKLDLRFVPDDMTFDREPKEVVMSDSLDLDHYKPSEFVNSALQQSKVDLTWDEDNPERVKNTRAAFTKEELEKTDLNAYLASSSGEEEEGSGDDQDSEEDEDGLTERERLEKYRSLVKDLDKEDEDGDAEMEITWEPALKETTEELVSQKMAQEEEDAGEKKSPWEQYLERKKEKRKEKKEKTKIEKKKMQHGSSDEEEAFSDDELPAGVDMDDPFFAQEDTKVSAKKKPKRKRAQEEESGKEDPEELKKKAELELLMMDDDDNKQHFNLKAIIERENPKKRKRKKQKQQTERHEKGDDAFEVDVRDSRFSAIYTSHHFAIDPSDPQFKRTKAMDAILEEKQTRRAKGGRKAARSQPQVGREETAVDKSKFAPEQGQVTGGGMGDVSALIKAIRRNTGNLQNNKKMKAASR